MKLVVSSLLLLTACSGSSAHPDAVADTASCTDAELAEVEAMMAATLDAAAVDPEITTDPDFTVLLETSDGRRFSYDHGASSATTRYDSASTSKWVTAVVVLDLVDRGVLALDTTANQLLPFWTETAVDLRELLSFTSGFTDEPTCINNPNATFAECVEKIYTDNAATAKSPGTEFYYSGTHMQVAGLMAIRAATATSWSELFAAFQARTGLFPTGGYDLPSQSNPRLGGGMTWTGEEYLGFLRALSSGAVLAPATRGALLANQRGTATVTASPVIAQIGEDWAYGLGNWLECPTAIVPATYDCGEGHRNSSAGAYGAYPFIDFDLGYFGIVARQGSLGSGDEGVALARTITSLAGRWATKTCD